MIIRHCSISTNYSSHRKPAIENRRVLSNQDVQLEKVLTQVYVKTSKYDKKEIYSEWGGVGGIMGRVAQ
jgi:hydroxymethylglutaryl-CoA reductase